VSAEKKRDQKERVEKVIKKREEVKGVILWIV